VIYYELKMHFDFLWILDKKNYELISSDEKEFEESEVRVFFGSFDADSIN
jgi:hypothetical protein